ncbi:MAG: hypothetical protein KF819_37110 [Labilithrix sp.]|nr:hypothetical protein [Labilithrix sp.]
MGLRRRLIALAFVALACASCKPKEPPKNDRPSDRLSPNEQVEGKERAFGLPLPRQARVEARFEKSVLVRSLLTPEELANFVRARVKEGTVTPGATSTVLEMVVPREDANKKLTIEVRPLRLGDGTKSEMVVRDTTPPPFEPNLSNEERWKKAGLAPNGQLLDPKHLE